MENGVKERQSNFEVLRIFSMLLIVFHHLCQHGLWFPIGTDLSANLFLSQCFYSWTGQLGNWLFILTSGYFVSKSEFSWKKVFKIWFQIFSISLAIGITLFLTKIPLIGFSNTDYESLGFFEAAKPPWSKANSVAPKSAKRPVKETGMRTMMAKGYFRDSITTEQKKKIMSTIIPKRE